MGGSLSQLDWVALAVVTVIHFFQYELAGNWTSALAQKKYFLWRQNLNSWILFPGWAWQPLLWITQALMTAATFLYWRNSFPGDSRLHRDAILGLIFANIALFKMWTPTLLWGPRYWWITSILSLFILGTSAAVLALFGVVGYWLSFGLYIWYPILACIMTITSLFLWWYNTDLMQGAIMNTRFDTRYGPRVTSGNRAPMDSGANNERQPQPRMRQRTATAAGYNY